MIAGVLSGCIVQQGRDKIEDLEFTVMDPADLPEELQQQIAARQEEDSLSLQKKSVNLQISVWPLLPRFH